MYRNVAAILFFSLFLVSCSSSQERPYLILVSFDGFRHDYVERYNLKNFKKIKQEGAYATRLIPSFPSKTFPNHYSIVTGMYPGTHGLVDNSFYDEEIDDVYTMSKRDMVEDQRFYGGKPIWNLANDNQVKSASYFWVGSEAPVEGKHPDYYYKYDGRVSNQERVMQAKKWLQLPENERPHLILLYFSLVDSEGHSTGPNSDNLQKATKEADKIVGDLIQVMEELKLPVNLVITSDHGMKEMHSAKEDYIFLDSLINNTNNEKIKVVSSGTHVHLYAEEQEVIDNYYDSLSVDESKFNIYKKENLPAKWHYNHDRVGDLLLVASPGVYFTTTERFSAMSEEDGGTWGTHGFDPYTDEDMGGILYGYGPNIKAGVEMSPVENIHIYPLLAEILQLKIQHEIDGESIIINKFYKNQ